MVPSPFLLRLAQMDIFYNWTWGTGCVHVFLKNEGNLSNFVIFKIKEDDLFISEKIEHI